MSADGVDDYEVMRGDEITPGDVVLTSLGAHEVVGIGEPAVMGGVFKLYVDDSDRPIHTYPNTVWRVRRWWSE